MVFRELKKYTVFLAAEQESIAYGVLALSQPFEEVIGPYLPIMVKTVLLPFKDKIVYDGLVTKYNISFGPGIRCSLNESFKKAKDRLALSPRCRLPPRRSPCQPKLPKPNPNQKPS